MAKMTKIQMIAEIMEHETDYKKSELMRMKVDQVRAEWKAMRAEKAEAEEMKADQEKPETVTEPESKPEKAEKPVKEAFNVYAMVTDRIIEQLEQGHIPWSKPWVAGKNAPFNRVSKKPYRGINPMLLKHGGEYASFKQWTELGGKIRKGEKSEIVVFWKRVSNQTEKDENGVVVLDENGNPKTRSYFVLRYYRVFHISQVEGVEPLETVEYPDVEIRDNDLNEYLNAYIDREGIDYQEIEGNDGAWYAPGFDQVRLPARKQFKAEAEYYSTKAHELVHSTLKAERCDRTRDNAGRSRFGSEDYSKEELVAEIGAAGLLNLFNVETDDSFRNSAAYIQSWIKVLRDDKKMIVSAAGKADKAIDYITQGYEGKTAETQSEPETTQEKPETKPEEPETEEKKTAKKGKKKTTKKPEGKTVKTAETPEEKLDMEIRHNIIGGFRWMVDGYYNSFLDRMENVLPKNYAELKQDIYDEVTNNRFDQTGKRLGKMPKDQRATLPEKEIREMIAELCGTDEAVKEMAVALKW